MVSIVLAAIIATLLPARGAAVPVVDWASRIMIAVLFFLYGVRLRSDETLAGLRHWRLHGVILSFTFLVFPILGLAMRPLVPELISEDIYRGLLWICLLPSTVQSSSPTSCALPATCRTSTCCRCRASTCTTSCVAAPWC